MDPKLVSAVRELRDRFLEHINSPESIPLPSGKYEVSRQLGHASTFVQPVSEAAVKQLPEAA